MLDKVKTALRVSTSAFDGEITDIIEAATADLRLVGVPVPDDISVSGTAEPLITRAVILYAKANFGYSDDAERYRAAYDYLKCALSLSDEYTEGGGGV